MSETTNSTATFDIGTLPPLIVRLLEARGLATADYAEFFNPSLARLSVPEELPGIAEAADLIFEAVAARSRIVVFGDYDCDGVCATAIIVKTLTACGADVAPILPRRLDEGYGMSDAAVARMLADYPDTALVITVDNGINAISEVASLQARGIVVIVTDHHLPGPELPLADALVDPKVDAPEKLSGLCGAGVAYLLARAFVERARERFDDDTLARGLSGELLVMAGLATVTDVMPLVDENRILVSEALRHFQTWAPIGLRELHARAARTGVERLISKDFGFVLGPRLNAAGRLADAIESLELLVSDDREIVRELARIVDMRNGDRRAIEQQMSDAACAKIVPDAPAQVLDLPDGHPGIAGIVAARVMDRVHVPVCVITGDHGSGRAPEGFNLRDAFCACEEVLVTYGGHAAAGGFSVKSGCIDRFRELLSDYCLKQRELGILAEKPADAVDAWVDPAELTLELADWIGRMEPFGEGNPKPVFGLRARRLADAKPLGSDGRHLALRFRGDCPRAIWWGRGDLVETLRASANEPRDIRCTVEISEYGERHVELRIVSMSGL